MITRLKIKNYRSILSCDISLNKLTVIVGANGSGKSSLIRAIEFISNSIDEGLPYAVEKRGGFSEITPKQFVDTNDINVEFGLEAQLSPPSSHWDRYKLPAITIEYNANFSGNKDNSPYINTEKLVINEPILVSKFLKNTPYFSSRTSSKEKQDTLSKLTGSRITFYRNDKPKILSNTNFSKFKEYIKDDKLSAYWVLGKIWNRLISDSDTMNFATNQLINQFISIQNNSDDFENQNKRELILSKKRFLYNSSSHFTSMINQLSSFKGYDLFLNELRNEQEIKISNKIINSEGSNMPSVARQLKENSPKSWKRVLRTLSNISPFVEDVQYNTLRAGKDYLSFSEIFNGRDIASWETSDGTLRSFAILLAIETHPVGSTLMIEEPEHGLHPWAIKDMIEHMREVIEERNLQIIFTTHSPQVLEELNPDELIIAERDEHKGTIYRHLRDIIPESRFNKSNMIDIGRMWVKGLLKGVPTY